MKWWNQSMRTAIEVTSAASEECARAGQPAIDVQHLLLGLVLSGGEAGEILRSHGITIDSARAAIDQLRADEVATLGVEMPAVAARPLSPAYANRLTWTPRAKEVLKRTPRPHRTTGTLRALVEEPSGVVRRVLQRLDVDPDSLLVELSAASASRGETTIDAAGPDGLARVAVSGFVPAPIDEVWAVVSDPMRRPEWDDFTADVEPAGTGVWRVTTQSVTLRGKKKRDRRPVRIRELARDDAARRVVHETTWPGRRGSVVQRSIMTLRPAGSGTAVEVQTSLRPERGVRRLLQRASTPLYRFVTTTTLSQQLAGLSRHFR